MCAEGVPGVLSQRSSTHPTSCSRLWFVEKGNRKDGKKSQASWQLPWECFITGDIAWADALKVKN